MPAHGERRNHDGRQAIRPDLLDILVRHAFHTSLDLHGALATTGGHRAGDHIRDAINRIDDIIHRLRELALDLDTATPGELAHAWLPLARPVDRSAPPIMSTATPRLTNDGAHHGADQDTLPGSPTEQREP